MGTARRASLRGRPAGPPSRPPRPCEPGATLGEAAAIVATTRKEGRGVEASGSASRAARSDLGAFRGLPYGAGGSLGDVTLGVGRT